MAQETVTKPSPTASCVHNTTVNLVIIALSVIAETGLVGCIVLAYTHAEAVYLATLGGAATTAVGALGALLSFTGRTPQAGAPGQPPANVVVQNPDDQPVPTHPQTDTVTEPKED